MPTALLWLGLAALVSGCTAVLQPALTAPAIAPDQILEAAPLGIPADPSPPDDTAILAVDDDMAGFLAARVDHRADDSRRLEQLLDALMGHGTFQLQYDRAATQTAAEIFRSRRGNCLSFTNLFVALARSTGLTAGYEEVDVPPDWTQEGDNVLVTRHVNAYVRIPATGDRAVDFDARDSRASYERRHISDARARAHYYSNIGVDRLLGGDARGALQAYRRALASDPGFAPAWTNLGVLFLRDGYPDYAEAAYRQALAVDPGEFTAMSNLEALCRQQGRTAEADRLAGVIAAWRLANPYYRYHLAQQAYSSGDFRTAIHHLRFAVRRKPAEDSFCLLLALSYAGTRDAGHARYWLAEAERLAPDDSTRRGYHALLDRLPKGD